MSNKLNDVIRVLLAILALASLSWIVQNPLNVINNDIQLSASAAKSKEEAIADGAHNQNHYTRTIPETTNNILKQQQQQKSGNKYHDYDYDCHQPSQSHTNNNYTVSFLSSQHHVGWGEIYSGMWWQSIDSMLLSNFSRVGFLEQVTFLAFNDVSRRRNKQVLQTVDWLDLAVEHLSKYVKHFQAWSSGSDDSDSDSDGGVDLRMQLRVEEILLRYIGGKSKESCHHHASASAFPSSDTASTQSAITSTIAILPIRISAEIAGTDSSRLSMLQLSATIASLWNVGVPRVVVAGVAGNEKMVAQQAFKLLKGHLEIRPMALEYVPLGEGEVELVPKMAMIHFQNAVREFRKESSANGTIEIIANDSTTTTTTFAPSNKSSNVISSWLGDDPSRWQYIYFTEPDLVLHLRPEAVPMLSKKLKQGHLLNANRLQPLPHMQQFMDIYRNATYNASASKNDTRNMESKLLPNLAIFAAIHNLDVTSGDKCCDQGLFYPSSGVVDSPPTKPVTVRSSVKCYTQWAFCGFSDKGGGNYSDWSFLLEKHKLLLTYPFIALKKGTGLPLVHHGQRVCTPKRGPGVSC